MCPPHLVEKWAESIREEVPYAKVEILKELAQLVKLRKKGKKAQGKELSEINKSPKYHGDGWNRQVCFLS